MRLIAGECADTHHNKRIMWCPRCREDTEHEYSWLTHDVYGPPDYPNDVYTPELQALLIADRISEDKTTFGVWICRGNREDEARCDSAEPAVRPL